MTVVVFLFNYHKEGKDIAVLLALPLERGILGLPSIVPDLGWAQSEELP